MKPPATPLGVTLEELARLVGGEVRGVCEELILGITGIREAGKGQITFLVNPKYGKDLETTQASAVIVGRQFSETKKPLISPPILIWPMPGSPNFLLPGRAPERHRFLGPCRRGLPNRRKQSLFIPLSI